MREYKNIFDCNESKQFNYFDNLLNELSLVDKSSINFRFPTNKHFKKSLDFKEIDLNNFINITSKMMNFIESLNDFVQDSK